MPKYDFSDFDEKPKYDFSDFDAPVSQIESGVRGAAQGASMGFADELTAALESGAGSLGLVPDKTYEQSLAESRANYKAAQEANPLTSLAGNLAGGVGSALLMPTSAATIPGRIAQAAGMGAVTGYGMNENRDEALKDIAMGGAIGGAVGGLAEGATLGLKKLGESFGDSAKKLVLKGTGATGKQAEKFKEGTADYLLNSGKFGMFDSPADIARKSDELLEQSGQRIGSIVDEASAAGGKVNRQEILDKLRAKMEQEIRDGNGDSARRLATIVKDLEATPLDDVSLSFAQGQKKKFNDLAKSHALPMDKTGNDLAGSLYNEAVESQIAKTTPELSGAFDAAKAEYGMLKPINQFSTARAQTLNQSPAGGLLDATRAVAGGQVGGIAGMFAAAIGGKALASRAPNMMAHSLNKVSKLIKTPPAMLGKFAPIIQNAAVRGQNAVAVTDWLLEQNNSEYREMKSRLEDGN